MFQVVSRPPGGWPRLENVKGDRDCGREVWEAFRNLGSEVVWPRFHHILSDKVPRPGFQGKEDGLHPLMKGAAKRWERSPLL